MAKQNLQAIVRAAYRPHDPEIEDERPVLDKGWLLKARFPEEEVPNVSWFWIPLGNCHVCRHFVPADAPDGPACTNTEVGTRAMLNRWSFRNDCPGYGVGLSPQYAAHPYEGRMLAAMIAAGLVPGRPSQRVDILQKLRWSPWRSFQAHWQQRQFRAHAQFADSGEDNPADSLDYVDLGDDLGHIDEGEEPS